MKMNLIILASLFYAHAVGQNFTLTSKDLTGQIETEQVFNGFGCTGKNYSPELSWSNPPAGTKSFAITLYDPDAPTGSGWWHWVVSDIPATIRHLENHAKIGVNPKGIEYKTDFGQPGYGGPCPPEKDAPHKYEFTIYALDILSLGLDENASPALVGFLINQHLLAKSTLTVYYQR